MKQQKCSSHKNVIVFCFRKRNLFIKFPCEAKILPFDLVFSNCVVFIKKAPLINCLRSSNTSRVQTFFSTSKVKFFKKRVLFFVSLRSLLFSNCELAIVYQLKCFQNFFYLSIYLSIYLFVYLSIFLSFFLSIYLSIYLSIIYLSTYYIFKCGLQSLALSFIH